MAQVRTRMEAKGFAANANNRTSTGGRRPRLLHGMAGAEGFELEPYCGRLSPQAKSRVNASFALVNLYIARKTTGPSGGTIYAQRPRTGHFGENKAKSNGSQVDREVKLWHSKNLLSNAGL